MSARRKNFCFFEHQVDCFGKSEQRDVTWKNDCQKNVCIRQFLRFKGRGVGDTKRLCTQIGSRCFEVSFYFKRI